MPVPLIAAASTAGEVAGFVGGLFGGTSAQRDKARFASADQLYARAAAGDAAARAELVRLSTHFATLPARQYAAQLVARLPASTATLPNTSAAAPITPGSAPAGGAPSLLGGDLQQLVLIGLLVAAAFYFFGRR